MEITTEEVKYINSYIKETASVTGKPENLINAEGTYTLDGVQAVAYGRIRYTAGGDYKRTERMRDVVIAILKKLKTKSFTEINDILDVISKNGLWIRQNYFKWYFRYNITKNLYYLTISDIILEIPSTPKYKIVESLGWPYEVKAYTTPTWYGVPVTLESNVTKMHKEIFNENNYIASDMVKNISNSIIKKTGYDK